ncbi:MAG TPA: cupin domain-containing protein [Candidatus Omnitrophota bacterium]|nr:cupin domain-containing protein [Candidatus Omnitrophota bacterium]
MKVIPLKKCEKFISGDHCVLREMLHPDKMKAAFRYSLAHATLKPGLASTPHKLRTSEVYYIVNGRGLMHIDKGSAKVKAGDTIYIPPHSRQYIKNTGKKTLEFLCIVDPAWRAQDEEVF